jgi:hypothetical protein
MLIQIKKYNTAKSHCRALNDLIFCKLLHTLQGSACRLSEFDFIYTLPWKYSVSFIKPRHFGNKSNILSYCHSIKLTNRIIKDILE